MKGSRGMRESWEGMTLALEPIALVLPTRSPGFVRGFCYVGSGMSARSRGLKDSQNSR